MPVLAIILAIILLVAVSVVWTIPRGAPWVPTPKTTIQDMLNLANVQPDELVYDLGCGDGRVLVTAAVDYQARAVGIELDPLRWLWCQGLITVLGLRKQVRVLYGDLFKHDLSPADVVTCYLLPDANKRLQAKLFQELRPGTRVVSNTFLFPALKEIEVKDKARLYLFSSMHTQEAFLRKQFDPHSDQKPKVDHS